jgi:hypothetical protein
MWPNSYGNPDAVAYVHWPSVGLFLVGVIGICPIGTNLVIFTIPPIVLHIDDLFACRSSAPERHVAFEHNFGQGILPLRVWCPSHHCVGS